MPPPAPAPYQSGELPPAVELRRRLPGASARVMYPHLRRQRGDRAGDVDRVSTQPSSLGDDEARRVAR
jgi:hypothetical protein